MTAYDQRSYTISGSGSPTGMKQPWFKAAQTAVGWGTTANMGATTTYRMRAYDSGRATYVYWTNTATPVLAPSAGDTTPNFTGSLTNPSIIGTG